MSANYVDFYSLKLLVNMIENIQYVFVRVMDFDKIYGHHLLKDLIYEMFTNSMRLRKAMLIFVINKIFI
jgi:hypothetical protein